MTENIDARIDQTLAAAADLLDRHPNRQAVTAAMDAQGYPGWSPAAPHTDDLRARHRHLMQVVTAMKAAEEHAPGVEHETLRRRLLAVNNAAFNAAQALAHIKHGKDGHAAVAVAKVDECLTAYALG